MMLTRQARPGTAALGQAARSFILRIGVDEARRRRNFYVHFAR